MTSAKSSGRSRGSRVAVLICSLVVLSSAPTTAQVVTPSPAASPSQLSSPLPFCAPPASAAPVAPSETPDAGLTAAPSVSPSPAAGACAVVGTVVDVQAFDLGFTPTTIEVPASGSTRIVFANTGRVVHNLTVDALGIQIIASRGGTNEAVVTDPVPGTYEFYCSVSGHRQAGMVGTLIVG
jgi:nitrite reductase (NO-forming)